MAKWYYYNPAGERIGPIRTRDLVIFTQNGTITPETRIEDANGRIGLAKNATGLQFPETTPEPIQTLPSVKYSSHDDMPNPSPHYFIVNSNGTKQGPISEERLKELAEEGHIDLDTQLKTDTGYTGTAGQIPGLKFKVVVPAIVDNRRQLGAENIPPVHERSFCTNCGDPVSDLAVVCLSCGGNPVAHKHFCRQCGATLHSEQIVCIKCGVKVTNTVVPKSAQRKQPLTGSMWLLDFRFRNIRLPMIIRLYCGIAYAITCFGLILSGFFSTFLLLTPALMGLLAVGGNTEVIIGSGPAISLFFGYSLISIVLTWLTVLLGIYSARLFFEGIIIILDWVVETTKAARLYMERVQ